MCIKGQTYTVSATEALSQFERQQMESRAALNQLVRVTAVQSGKGQPRMQEDRLLAKSQFKLPLQDVRPEMAGILRDLPLDEPPLDAPRPNETHSPFFSDLDDPEKYLKQGERIIGWHSSNIQCSFERD